MRIIRYSQPILLNELFGDYLNVLHEMLKF